MQVIIRGRRNERWRFVFGGMFWFWAFAAVVDVIRGDWLWLGWRLLGLVSAAIGYEAYRDDAAD